MKNALLTGAYGGIGRAVFEIFSKNQINTWACVRKMTDEFVDFCEELEKKYSVWIKIVAFDLQNESEIQAGMKKIFAAKQSIELVVNKAGMPHGALLQMCIRLIFLLHCRLFSWFPKR